MLGMYLFWYTLSTPFFFGPLAKLLACLTVPTFTCRDMYMIIEIPKMANAVLKLINYIWDS
jgi:hypothetical protein